MFKQLSILSWCVGIPYYVSQRKIKFIAKAIDKLLFKKKFFNLA